MAYTVTFDTGGGSSVAPLTEQTNLPTPLPTTTKANHVFAGWYYDNLFTQKARAGATIESNVTLYAKWYTPTTWCEDIADAIREKEGSSGDIKHVDFPDRIEALPSPKEEQTKTVSPTTSSQDVLPDTGKVLSKVTVNAIPTETKSQQPNLSSGNETINATSGKFMTSFTITKDTTNHVASNIRSGKTLYGVTGNLQPAKEEETKTVTPNFSSGNVVVTPTSGKVMTQVTFSKDTTNHIAGNIKKDITLYGVTGTLESGGGLPSGSFVVTANGSTSFTITGANANNEYFIIGTTANLFYYNTGWKRLYGLDDIINLSSTSFRIELHSYGDSSVEYFYPPINKIIVMEYITESNLDLYSESASYIDNTIIGYKELTGYLFEWRPCYVRDTSIALYDNTYKPVQDITYDDNLLVWDFDNCRYTTAKPLWILKSKSANKYTKLTFDDGIILSLIGEENKAHRVFDYDKGYFEYGNCLPIGARTINDKGEFITLIDKETIYEEVEYYNIITDYHMNLFSNTVLTSCGYNNIYPIENMKFVKDERELIPIEDYNVDSKWYTGLRLGEQDLSLRSIEKAHKYIANLVKNDINQ